MTTTIKDLKIGEYFKLKENGRVYVRSTYNRITKKYEYYDFHAVNCFHECKGSQVVITDLNDDDFDLPF